MLHNLTDHCQLDHLGNPQGVHAIMSSSPAYEKVDGATEQQPKGSMEQRHEANETDPAALKERVDTIRKGTEEAENEFEDLKGVIAELEKQIKEAEKRIKEAEKQSEEDVKLRKEAEKQSEEDVKLRKEAEKQIKEDVKRRKEAEKRSEAIERHLSGTYYATFDEVWDPCPVAFDSGDYDTMIRAEFPTYESHDSRMKSLFGTTMENAMNSDFDVTPDIASRSSHSTFDSESKDEIWPVNVVDSKFHDRNDRTKFIPVEQGATHETSNESRPFQKLEGRPFPVPLFGHLVPASSVFASLYYHVAIWVFGECTRNYEPNVVQKLIHGSVPCTKPEIESTQRAGGIGLKHMICNKIRVSCLCEHFDKNPRLMIVPVLSLKQAKEWRGEGYDAIFMISTGHKEKGCGVGLWDVAASVLMQPKDWGERENANASEISLAEELLTATIKGLAFSLVNKSDGTEDWVSALSEESRTKLANLRLLSSLVNGEKVINVPTKRLGNEKPVLKVTFGPAFGTVGEYFHPAPDPLLLAVRAGLNWSAFHEQRLMPAIEDDDLYSTMEYDDSDMSEGSIATMEEYLAMRENDERARRDEEIVNMSINIS